MNVLPLWSLNATLVGHVGTYSKRDPKKKLKRPSGPSDWQCMQAVMSVIEKYGREHGCWQASHKDWNYKNVICGKRWNLSWMQSLVGMV
jgi:hypothetical protein